MGPEVAAGVTRRKPLGKKLRFEVFKRDGFKCMYCGAHPPAVILHVDHIEAVANGGTNVIENLITACEPCNLGKGARALTDAPIALADRALMIQEQEEQIRGYSEAMRERRLRVEREAFDVLDVFCDAFGYEEVPPEHLRSVRHFLDKLHVSELIDAMYRAVDKVSTDDDCFRYFCGICWKKIREQQERAA